MLLAPAAASANWGTPINVSGLGSSVSDTNIAGGTDGTSWVVWKRNVGGFDVVQGTRVAVDGSQGAILTLSSATANADEPVVESRSDGSVTVGWIDTSGAQDTVRVVSIASDGTVGSPVQVSNTSGTPMDSKDIDLALGQDGTVGVTWLALDGPNWVAQAARIAADGTVGAVLGLSDGTTVSAGPPSIAVAPPASTGAAVTYRIFWPQGSGATSNVGSRQINADGTITDLYLALAQPGGDPFDVQVTYGTDGALNVFWVRNREAIDPANGSPFSNWAIEWLRALRGVTLNPAAPTPVNAATPMVPGQPYNVTGLNASETFGGQPAVAWVRNLDGGGQRVQTARVVPSLVGATFDAWATPSGTLTAAEAPTIEANKSNAGVAGWTVPGLLPDQGTSSWTRFSNSAVNPFSPPGSYVYSEDPGFAMADSGKVLAAFTGIDAGSLGSAVVSAFSAPGISVAPNTANYGQINIGATSTRYLSIRSSGETPMVVTDITLSGSESDQFGMSNPANCVREIASGSACQVPITFRPGSTGSKSATITVQSDAGSRVVNLAGAGLNRTRNRITAKPGRAAARKGKNVRFQVTASNVGGVTSNSTRVCVNLRKRVLKLAGNRCRSLGALPAGGSRTLNFRIRVTWRAPQGKNLPVTFQMRSNNSVVRQVVVKVRRKGR